MPRRLAGRFDRRVSISRRRLLWACVAGSAGGASGMMRTWAKDLVTLHANSVRGQPELYTGSAGCSKHAHVRLTAATAYTNSVVTSSTNAPNSAPRIPVYTA